LAALIPVIALTGILTAIALPAYNGYIEKSKESQSMKVKFQKCHNNN